jgi:CHASE3 domain sensor protein
MLAMGAISHRRNIVCSESERWAEHPYKVLENIKDLLLSIETIELSYRGFVLTDGHCSRGDT